MPKTKFISKVIAGVMLSIALTTVGKQVVQAAQRPVFLLSSKCVNSGLGSAEPHSVDVSIGRAVYTSRFYLGPGNGAASITCKIRRNDSQAQYQTLQMGFGLRDTDYYSPAVTVNVYLDGRRAASKTVAPGRTATLSLNVSDATNVAVETVCSSRGQSCSRVYFFDASLEPIVSSRSRSK